jgi:hypothetical protein
MQERKCIKEKIQPISALTTILQESREKILDLPFTSLGTFKVCAEGKFDTFPHRASPRKCRSRSSTRPNSSTEDELIYAMEKFPDFFPPEYLSCSDRTVTEQQEHLRERIHQENPIDSKVVDWLRQEYGI